MDWFSFGCEVCIEIIKSDSEIIGGPGMIIELDESKFGKRKNNKSRLVEGQWVFGGIETVSNPVKYVFEIVDKRDASTLLPLIQK